MTTQRQYDAATAQAIMRLAYPEYEDEACAPYVSRDDGMYVNESLRQVSPSGTVFDWTPANETDWSDAPNPDTAPFLPIPFTANELAACLLEGPGRNVQDVLDRRIGYPLDDGALGSISARHRWMRDALQEAYALAAAAQLIVGEFDYEEQARAYELVRQYDDADGKANDYEGVFEHGITREEACVRRARAAASVADLKAQTREAQATVADKWKAWRKAMVQQLLQPQRDAGSITKAAPTADSASNAPAWTVNKPQRYSGYTAPLHSLIAAAHRKGEPRPSARAVVEAWRTNPPAEIAKVLADSIDYYDSQGDTKPANLEAIRKAIGRMTSAR